MIVGVTAGVRLLHKLLEFFQNVSRNFSKICSKVRLFFKVISRNDTFWKKIVGANKRRPLRRKLPVQNHTLSNGETVYPDSRPWKPYPLPRFSGTYPSRPNKGVPVGTLQNYGGDGKGNVKAGNRFNGQNNNSARASRFFVHFFAVPA